MPSETSAVLRISHNAQSWPHFVVGIAIEDFATQLVPIYLATATATATATSTTKPPSHPHPTCYAKVSMSIAVQRTSGKPGRVRGCRNTRGRGWPLH